MEYKRALPKPIIGTHIDEYTTLLKYLHILKNNASANLLDMESTNSMETEEERVEYAQNRMVYDLSCNIIYLCEKRGRY